MKVERNIALGASEEEEFLKYVAFGRVLPEEFVIKSHAQGGLQIDPETPIKAVLEKFNDYRLHMHTQKTRITSLLLETEKHFLLADVHPGRVRLSVVSSDNDASPLLEKLKERFSAFKFENKEEDGIWIEASFLSDCVNRLAQFIRAPKWDEIQHNYPSIRSQLSDLFAMKEPWKHGRIMIWFGPPGTGKTYCIRSLMMAWRQWFNFIVVTDPERLTAEPAYYYQVASDSAERPMRYRLEVDDEDASTGVSQKGDKRVLFILEDTADLIMPESRSQHFDKINKLLNITDGLLGQGREDLFLITFNEPVERIDPAFTRPGRCLSKIEFPKLSKNEAEHWLETRDSQVSISDEMTLAELYARVLKESTLAPN